jgi:hypothetical protein
MNWRELNARLSTLREDELAAMIEEERQGERRATLLVRMHQRFTALRTLRERQELLSQKA